jgi:hypothetical protein
LLNMSDFLGGGNGREVSADWKSRRLTYAEYADVC